MRGDSLLSNQEVFSRTRVASLHLSRELGDSKLVVLDSRALDNRQIHLVERHLPRDLTQHRVVSKRLQMDFSRHKPVPDQVSSLPFKHSQVHLVKQPEVLELHHGLVLQERLDDLMHFQLEQTLLVAQQHLNRSVLVHHKSISLQVHQLAVLEQLQMPLVELARYRDPIQARLATYHPNTILRWEPVA